MSTTNTQSAVGFIGPGERGLPMATAIAVAGYPLHVWARHPGPLSHTPPSAPADRRAPHSVRGGGSGDKPGGAGITEERCQRHAEFLRTPCLRSSTRIHPEYIAAC
jgi:hypothetical protein